MSLGPDAYRIVKTKPPIFKALDEDDDWEDLCTKFYQVPKDVFSKRLEEFEANGYAKHVATKGLECVCLDEDELDSGIKTESTILDDLEPLTFMPALYEKVAETYSFKSKYSKLIDTNTINNSGYLTDHYWRKISDLTARDKDADKYAAGIFCKIAYFLVTEEDCDELLEGAIKNIKSPVINEKIIYFCKAVKERIKQGYNVYCYIYFPLDE